MKSKVQRTSLRQATQIARVLFKPPIHQRDVETIFLRWTFLRAVFHRGYVIVAFLYFVVDAHLSASHLALLGTVMAVTLLLSDAVAGAWADAIGRRWALVVGHALLAAGMIMTALVTAYPLLAATQMLWGLGWAFSGGADVAWVTDELYQPERIDRVLAASARLSLIGAVAGMIAFGSLGWACGLAPAIAISGAGMAAMGLFVSARFSEQRFVPVPKRALLTSLSIFQRGLALVLRDKEILIVFAATVISESASIVLWLFPRELVDLGFAHNPVLWWSAIGVLSFAAGAVALRVIESRIHRAGAARWTYAFACFIGAIALAMLAYGNIVIACVGMLLTWGIGVSVTRAVSVIWVNRRTESDVRATVLSFLSQAKSIGGMVGGTAFSIVAKTTSNTMTLTVCAVLFAVAGAIVARFGAERAPAAAGEIQSGL